MQVAIISDSHYAVDKVRRFLSHLRREGIQYLIHAGDFTGPDIEKVFIDFPDITTWIARGNCDGQGYVIDELNRHAHVTVGEVVRFEIEGILFLISHIPGNALNALSRNPADVVIHGHTHTPRIETYNQALILNPGSIMEGDGFMLLEVPGLKVERYFNF